MGVNQTLLEQTAQRIMRRQADDLDRRLPEWARRSNPIVRRQLGVFWKLMTIDFDLIGRLYLLNACLIGLSLLVPFLFMLLMPAAVISFVALPVLAVVYALSLGRIAASAAESMADERAKGSLELLRVCPRPLREILYSKASAAVWRQIENIGLILTGVAAFSLPVLVIQYDWLFSAQDQPILMRLALLVGLASALARIPLETVMVASVGVAVGSFTRFRIAAMITAIGLGVAYFVAVNLARLLTTDPFLRLLLDIVLPLVAPLPIIALAYWAARRRIENE
jgi:hypothetical protein